MKKIGRLA